MKLLSLLLLLVAPSAFGMSQYTTTWQTKYPASQTMKNLPSSCQLCHNTAGGGSNFNKYGAALKTQMDAGASISTALTAVEGMNSDSDAGSFTNLQEITASTQPGWTTGSASLPSGIAGLLDPTGVPPPPPPPPVCTPPAVLTGGVCVTPPPPPPGACVSFTYTAWSACSGTPSTQTRTVASKTPANCTGGATPLISQLCAVPPPPPVCVPPAVLQGTVCVTPPPPPPPPPTTAAEPADVTACGGGWPMSGYGIHNTRNQSNESVLNVGNVGKLAVQQTVTLGGSIYPTLSVQAGFVYAADKTGYVYKVNAKTGAIAWKVNSTTLMGVPGAFVRVTPTLCNGQVIIAGWSVVQAPPSTAVVASLSQATGAMKWKTTIETDGGARLFQSPIIYQNKIYIGVGGLGAELAGYVLGPSAPAVTFRGSVVAMDFDSGAILWKTYMTPPGYSGAGVWAHTLVIDEKRQRLYAATGNNFSIPPASMACLMNITTDAGDMCMSPANHFDSLVSMNLGTGAIIWAKRMTAWDSYGCGPGCPSLVGAPDYDFPAGPQLYTTTINGVQQDVIGAGHKRGDFVAVNPDSADILWAKNIGPGSSLGGIERECAIDGARVFCGHMNYTHQLVTLKDGTTTQAGYWTAMDASTGDVLWQVANPTGARAISAVTVANGVVFGASLDLTGMIYAMDGTTGKILWSHATGGSNGGGVSVFNQRVYVGAGYGALDPYIDLGGQGNQLWVFALPGAPADPPASGGTVTPPSGGTCTYTYGSWSRCYNGKRSRAVTGTSPAGCTGTPVTTQRCGDD